MALVLLNPWAWPSASSAGELDAPTGFSDQLAANFDRWDRDRDGVLSFAETSALVPDASIRDEAAAALAAIHLSQRIDRWERLPFARATLTAPTIDEDAGRPPFESYYRIGLMHIRSTGRGLFPDGGPIGIDFHQGPLGDCFFVATLGALVRRSRDAPARIVREGRDGGYDVRFPDGEHVRVPHLSDAEIALGSFADRSGVWLNVLEKAYGELVVRALARRGLYEDAIDAPGHGGHATSALTLFTGNDSAILRYRPDDPLARPGAHRVEAFLPLTRSLLASNLARGRLTVCETNTAETPPGIAPRHLYAVLGFDPDTALVHVWNPWGNTFRPRPGPGLVAGYPTLGGHFSVPLADLIRIFDSLIYETDRPEDLD